MIVAYILLTIMIVVWSFNFIIVTYAVEYVPPLSIALYRFIIASISFAFIDLYHILTKKRKNQVKSDINKTNFSRNNWILIISASFIGQSLYFFTLYSAVDLIGPSLPALFVCLLSPVIIAILALIFFKEKMNSIKILGFIIATLGGFLLVTGGNLSNLTPSSPNYLGYVFALITPLQWGIYTTITKKISKSNSKLDMLKYITYLATIESFLFVLINGELEIFLETLFIPIVLITAIYTGLLCHVVGYYIYQVALVKMDSSKVASFLYIEPFITLIFSMLLQIDEEIVLWNIIGGVIVLFAILIINFEKKDK